MLGHVWPLRLCCSVKPSQQTGTSLQKDTTRLLSTVVVTSLYDHFVLLSFVMCACDTCVCMCSCVYAHGDQGSIALPMTFCVRVPIGPGAH